MNGFESLEDALEALELADDLDDLDMSEEEDAYPDEEAGWDDAAGLGNVLGEALHEDYADALPEELEAALDSILDSMSPAESFNFAKALQQIGKSAGQALSDPAVGQIARTALPIAAGAIGGIYGGPVGASLGSNLGTLAASALPGGAPARPAAPAPRAAAPTPTPVASPLRPALPAVAGGSAAAAQGLVLTQKPDVLKSLLALAMGQHGQKSVNGVPVAAFMDMLSKVFGQAAADADELMYLDGDGFDDESGAFGDSAASPGRSLYSTLMDAENYELAEAAELP